MNPDKSVESGDSLFVMKRYNEAIQAHERATEAEATHYEARQHKAEVLIR